MLLGNTYNIPKAFCWTKMGTEAGQTLEAIIARKNAEREMGEGIFFWGIGNALGQKIWDLIEAERRPSILFSPMKSKPKDIDVQPSNVFFWTSYIDRWGIKHPMPSHAIVTSRGTLKTIRKKRHYALVCKKSGPLKKEELLAIDWEKMKNYGGNTPLGYSQVTAVVEHEETNAPSNKPYEVLFGAELVKPYYITLSDPFELPCAALHYLNLFQSNNKLDTSKLYKWVNSRINLILHKAIGAMEDRCDFVEAQTSLMPDICPFTSANDCTPYLTNDCLTR